MIYKTQYNEQIESLFEKRNSLFPIKQEDAIKLYKKYRLEFNYNSNHIEGNTLTYGQTQLLLLFDKSSGDVPMSDLEEMKAHDVALKMIQEVALEKGRPLTEQLIKEINETILVRSFWKEAVTADGMATRKQIVPGEYKSSPNSVRLRNGEIHHYASPEETSAKMNDLMDWYRENETNMNPVQLAAEFHYRFVSIHPFDDGNGRVARLMMNYILFRFDYPMIIIKSKDKENYLTALQKADIGDRQAIIEYIERQMLWSLELDIKAANGEDLEEDDDIDKEIVLLKREKLEKTYIRKNNDVLKHLITYLNDEIYYDLVIMIQKFKDFFESINQSQFVELNTNDKNQKKILVDRDKLKSLDLANIFVNKSIDERKIFRAKWNISLNMLRYKVENYSLNLSMFCDFRESQFVLIIGLYSDNKSLTRDFNKTLYYSSEEYDIEAESISHTISQSLIQIIKSN